MKFIAKVLDEIIYSPNAWKGLKVGVFRVENESEEQVGEYERNYSSLFNTFHHFQKNGKDFALYSPDYTVTRIMELPSCRDIGGEEPNSWGFCPVDFFVPTYIETETSWETISQSGSSVGGETSQRRINDPKPEEIIERVETREFIHQTSRELCKITTNYRPLTSPAYYPFGFVAGCIWGDDGSWKVQYLDLSEVEKGIIKREERFGYIELLENTSLQEGTIISGYKNDSGKYVIRVRIKTIQTFDLISGKIVDPFE